MDEINVAAAARRLGLSEPAVRKMLDAGRLENLARSGPALVASADVDRVMQERRADALRRHPDPVGYARQVRLTLWPEERGEMITLADGRTFLHAPNLSADDLSGRAVLPYLTDASAMFGRAAMETAAIGSKVFHGACRFCFADVSARVHGGLRPTDAPAYRVLLGDPCPKDRQRWTAEAEARREEAARLRVAEQARRKAAEQARVRAEFQAARAEAGTAAQRLQKATRAYAPIDPSVAREAASQARQRGAFVSGPKPSKWPEWCDCNSNHQCAGHIEMDIAALRRGQPFRRSS